MKIPLGIYNNAYDINSLFLDKYIYYLCLFDANLGTVNQKQNNENKIFETNQRHLGVHYHKVDPNASDMWREVLKEDRERCSWVFSYIIIYDIYCKYVPHLSKNLWFLNENIIRFLSYVFWMSNKIFFYLSSRSIYQA